VLAALAGGWGGLTLGYSLQEVDTVGTRQCPCRGVARLAAVPLLGSSGMARISAVPWIPCHGPRVSRCCDEAMWSDRRVNLPDGLCPVDCTPVDQRGLEAPQFEKQAVLRRLGTRSRFLSKQEWRRVRLEGPPRKSECAHHTHMPAHAVRPCRGWVHAKCGAHVNDACRVSEQLVAERTPS
jgi:hypothetical protein